MVYTKWHVLLSIVVLLVACGNDDLVVETSFDSSVEDIEEISSSSVKEKSSSSSKGNSSAKENVSSSSAREPDSSATDSVPAAVIKDKTIYGVAQKGPFRAGTKVKIYELDAKTFAQTGKYFEGKVQSDKDGSFVVPGVTLSSPYVLFEVSGSNITLNALADLSDHDTVNVNVLTHLEQDRVFYLLEQGLKFFSAKILAEVDVLSAFYIMGSHADFEDMSIAGDKGSAELLAVSVLSLCYGGESKLAEFLKDFAADIKEDGKWNNEIAKAKIADEAQNKYFEGKLDAIYQDILGWKIGSLPSSQDYKKRINDFWSRIYDIGFCPAYPAYSTDSVARHVNNKNSSIYDSDICFYCKKSKIWTWLRGSCIDGPVDGPVDEPKQEEVPASGDDGQLREGDRGDVEKFDEILGRWVDANEEDYTLMLDGCTFKRRGEISKSPKDGAYYYCDSCPDAILWYNNGAAPGEPPSWRKAVDVDFVRHDEKCEAGDVGRIIERADSVTGSFYCTVNGWTNLKDWSYDVPKEFRFNPDIDYGTLTDDRDGKKYKTVKIGDQVWMAENLNYAGPNDDISRCYEDMPVTCEAGGRLYSLSVADTVCPSGWHLPKKEEFEILLTTVGGIDKASNELRSISGWTNDYSGSDAYGFSAVPTGGALIESYHGDFFSYSGYNAYFFSSDGYVFSINLWNGILLDNRRGWPVYDPNEALLPVRCLKDAE